MGGLPFANSTHVIPSDQMSTPALRVYMKVWQRGRAEKEEKKATRMNETKGAEVFLNEKSDF